MTKLELLTLNHLKHSSCRHTLVVVPVTKHCRQSHLCLDIHTAIGMHSVADNRVQNHQLAFLIFKNNPAHISVLKCVHKNHMRPVLSSNEVDLLRYSI